MGTELIENHSQHFKHIVRVSWEWNQHHFSGKNYLRSGLGVDPGAPEMFSFNMIYGSREGLKETHSIMLAAIRVESFIWE
jgi:hypothetical protein